MRLRASQNWFEQNAQQDVFMKAARLPVLIRTGPSSPQSNKEPKPEANKSFRVGVSRFDGEDVVQ